MSPKMMNDIEVFWLPPQDINIDFTVRRYGFACLDIGGGCIVCAGYLSPLETLRRFVRISCR